MNMQPLAVMATEENHCQNVPFLYRNIEILLYSLLPPTPLPETHDTGIL